jgi:hypothetical protein
MRLLEFVCLWDVLLRLMYPDMVSGRYFGAVYAGLKLCAICSLIYYGEREQE